MIRKVTFEEAKRLMDSGAVTLDVRDEEEYISGHAEGALLLPLDEITEDSACGAIPSKSREVVVYCRTGARSAKAAELLQKLGFENIFDAGGLLGWPFGLRHGAEF